MLFRMHESESWGQVQQSVKEGEERMEGLRLGGGGGAKRKEKCKVNGFMAAVIIRLDENGLAQS